ncbi:MAG: RES domain-containing protein [Gammaproteobacteria bacterium]|jgi:hypothetical protein|nr:RES domain-containing protein [Gammaproteobacteria bacterium]
MTGENDDLPPSDFPHRDLVTAVLSDRYLYRASDKRHTDGLGAGLGNSRFSDNRELIPDSERFRILYMASDPRACFLETVIRDRRNYPSVLPDSVVRRFRCVHLQVVQPLQLVDLTGDALTRMRIPTDVRGWSHHALSQAWALAFHQHPAQVDGIRYPCRHDETLTNIALFDKALTGSEEPGLQIVADPWPDYDALIDDLLVRYRIEEIADLDTAAMPDPEESTP